MFRYKIYMGLFFVFVVVANAKAQQDSIAGPSNLLAKWQQENLQEKIFVHTDRDVYLPGETMWFKIYDVDGSFHLPLHVSDGVYIELIDKLAQPVLQTRLDLTQQDGSGSLIVPNELHSGYYRLRCYTRWMKNYDAHLFFEKIITVLNIQQGVQDTLSRVKKEYALDIFPEGGNLVSGLESNIAFHVVDQYGNGASAQGVVQDNGKDTILRYKTTAMGTGHFKLLPVPGHTYLARITTDDGQSIEKQFPPAADHGITMQVIPAEGERVGIYFDASESATPSVYLVANTRGIIKMAKTVSITNGKGSVMIDKSALDEGITRFTVFYHNQPICERMYFTYPRNRFHLEGAVDAANYKVREKIHLRIEANDEKGKPAASNLSLSVYQVDSLQMPGEAAIDASLLLNADLGGYIESPSWYFQENGQGREEAMDNLMLTGGWNRLNIASQKLEKNQSIKFAPEYNGQIVDVKVTDKPTGTPLDHASVFLSMPGEGTKFWSVVSDPQGVATFEMRNAHGSQLVYQSPDSNAVITPVSPFVPVDTGLKMPGFDPGKNIAAIINRKNIYLQVQQVYNESAQNHFLAEKSVEPFYGKPDITYIVNRFTKFSTIEETLREYVREVNVTNVRGNFHLQVYDELRHGPFPEDPLILLDGVAVPDIDRFMSYDPLKIKSISVVTRKYFLGGIHYYGIIDCKTYKGDLNGFEMDPHAVVLDYDALQQQRVFYSPAYETPAKKASRLPDFRTLLYWNPSLKTSSTAGVDVDFFASDAAGKYVAVIQGISSDGKPATRMVYFEVKK